LKDDLELTVTGVWAITLIYRGTMPIFPRLPPRPVVRPGPRVLDSMRERCITIKLWALGVAYRS
jgi:hypothetical protein